MQKILQPKKSRNYGKKQLRSTAQLDFLASTHDNKIKTFNFFTFTLVFIIDMCYCCCFHRCYCRCRFCFSVLFFTMPYDIQTYHVRLFRWKNFYHNFSLLPRFSSSYYFSSCSQFFWFMSYRTCTDYRSRTFHRSVVGDIRMEVIRFK